jgi:hypothetical protein
MTDQTTTPETTTDAPAGTPAAQLQLQDLMLAAQVIQLASQRGAIRAEEMTQVGGLYERIVAFLQASGALQPAQTPAADAPAGTPATPVAQ